MTFFPEKITSFFPGKRKNTLVILVATALLSLAGCDKYNSVHDPSVSDLVMDGATMPEVNRISIPLPAAEPNRRTGRSASSSLWSSGSSSFFEDQRAQAVGDILTVVIEIDDKAQLRNASARSRSGNTNLENPVFAGYGAQIGLILPGIDPETFPTGDIIDLGSASGAAGEGSIRRNESIRLRIAALIIKELPNNNFVIAGRQEVKVNNELRELRIAGIIRPQDVDAENTVSYDKIAEARITYGGTGQISVVQQPRYGEDFLDIILPY